MAVRSSTPKKRSSEAPLHPQPAVVAEGQALKARVLHEARNLGADVIGVASVERWAEYNELPVNYWPQSVWRQAKSVIVMGVPMLLPIIESTPSINYTVMYDTTNILLDQMGYRLAVYLNNLGHASVFMPRDGYGSLDILLTNKMEACFSQVYAGKYAGLGTIGYSHNLINPKHGPRVRYVSVLTAAVLPSDPMIEKDLCNKCEICRRLCPTQAFTTRPDKIVADMDAVRCTKYHQVLLKEKRWPCGVCAKVCPIGEDRKLYNSRNVGVYLKEREAIQKNPADPQYQHLVHLRIHGSDGKRCC